VVLREAAWAAERLGQPQEAAAFRAEAEDWTAALVEHLLPRYGNERDPVITPHPSGALSGHSDALRRRFADWFAANRLDAEGRRKREALLTYFEAAQIHNALLLGLTREAWVCLDGMLDDASRPYGVAAWTEGQPGGTEFLPYRNDPGARGWLNRRTATGGAMPHNWTSAEVLCCLRTVFVREEGGGLALGLGVPARRINEIVQGKRSVTADTALRLARYFGTSPRFWIGLQGDYDLDVANDRLGKRLEREVRVPALVE
jgi:addiction module HigA family antidote